MATASLDPTTCEGAIAASTPRLVYTERPCAICSTPHRNPWPACDAPDCKKAWRARSRLEQQRERYRFRREKGKCQRCGVKAKEGHTRCVSCLKEARDADTAKRQKAAAERRQLEAVAKIVDAEMRKRAIQVARVEAGLELSKEYGPRLPKAVKKARPTVEL